MAPALQKHFYVDHFLHNSLIIDDEVTEPMLQGLTYHSPIHAM